jgi:hypothetical protein
MQAVEENMAHAMEYSVCRRSESFRTDADATARSLWARDDAVH